MITCGTKRLSIGILPMQRKIRSSSKNISSWRPFAKKWQITSRTAERAAKSQLRSGGSVSHCSPVRSISAHHLPLSDGKFGERPKRAGLGFGLPLRTGAAVFNA